jgi:hypothetical protein
VGDGSGTRGKQIAVGYTPDRKGSRKLRKRSVRTAQNEKKGKKKRAAHEKIE